jgi:hypothetical protein
MKKNLQILPLVLLLAQAGCGGEEVDESLHGGPQIQDSLNLDGDSVPTPEVPAVIEGTLDS